MAELLGVVASGISVASIAIQVGDSVLKLKEFWDIIKNAPEEIKYLIDEIETLSLILADIGNSDRQGELPLVGLESAKKCFELCQKGSGILEGVVRELEEKIGKGKKIGGVKAAVKKGMIERLRDRLRNAQFMLMLSNQTYYEALQRQRHDIQKQLSEAHQKELGELKLCVYRATEIILPLQEQRPLPSFVTSSEASVLPKETEKDSPRQISATTESKRLRRRCQTISSAATRQKEFRARIKAPSWLLFTNTLDICYSRVAPGWKISMTAYRVVPMDSELFQYVKEGNLIGLQRLFGQKKASPFDRIEFCWPTPPVYLLELAALYRQFGICQLFLFEGGNSKNLGIREALRATLRNGVFAKSPESYFELVRLLAQADDDYDPLELHIPRDNFWIYKHSFLTPPMLSWFLQRASVCIQDLSVENCAKLTIMICSQSNQRYMGILARILLEGRKIDSSLCNIVSAGGTQLVHCIARQLGSMFAGPLLEDREQILVEHWDPKKWPSKADKWQNFTSLQNLLGFALEVLITGPQLNSVALQAGLGGRPFTPLLSVIFGFFEANRNQVLDPLAGGALTASRMWLRLLPISGIDLDEYGRKEKLIHATSKVAKKWTHVVYRAASSDFLACHVYVYKLISFNYGPKLSDWKFWITEDMDHGFLEFSDMIDHPERAIPGSWNEESDYRLWDS